MAPTRIGDNSKSLQLRSSFNPHTTTATQLCTKTAATATATATARQRRQHKGSANDSVMNSKMRTRNRTENHYGPARSDTMLQSLKKHTSLDLNQLGFRGEYTGWTQRRTGAYSGAPSPLSLILIFSLHSCPPNIYNLHFST